MWDLSISNIPFTRHLWLSLVCHYLSSLWLIPWLMTRDTEWGHTPNRYPTDIPSHPPNSPWQPAIQWPLLTRTSNSTAHRRGRALEEPRDTASNPMVRVVPILCPSAPPLLLSVILCWSWLLGIIFTWSLVFLFLSIYCMGWWAGADSGRIIPASATKLHFPFTPSLISGRTHETHTHPHRSPIFRGELPSSHFTALDMATNTASRAMGMNRPLLSTAAEYLRFAGQHLIRCIPGLYFFAVCSVIPYFDWI